MNTKSALFYFVIVYTVNHDRSQLYGEDPSTFDVYTIIK